MNPINGPESFILWERIVWIFVIISVLLEPRLAETLQVYLYLTNPIKFIISAQIEETIFSAYWINGVYFTRPEK